MKEFRPLNAIEKLGGYLIRDIFIGEKKRDKYYTGEVFFKDDHSKVIAKIEPNGDIQIKELNRKEKRKLDSIYERIIKTQLCRLAEILSKTKEIK